MLKNYRKIADALSLMFFVLDEAGTILFVNQKGIEQLGYAENELLGKPVSSIFYPADRPQLLAHIESIKQSENQAKQWELRKVCKDGRVIFVSENVQIWNENGRKLFFVICEDITERKQAHEALRQSERRWQNIVDSTEVIFWATDCNGVFTISEGAGLKLIGRKPKQVVGQSVYELYKDQPHFIKQLKRILDGETFSHVVNFGDLWFDAFCSPVRDENGLVVGANGVITNVTARIKAEQKNKAAVRQLETLTGLVSAAISQPQVEELLKGLADAIVETTNFETCLVLEFTDEKPRRMRFCSFSRNFSPDIAENFPRLLFDAETFQKFIKEGELIEVGELGKAVYERGNADSTFYRIVEKISRLIKRRGFISHRPLWSSDSLIVPINAPENDFFGMIILKTELRTVRPEREDVFPVVVLARQLSQIFAHRRATQKLSDQIKREALISRISKSIRESLNINEVLQAATRELGQTLNVSRCYIRFNHETEVLPAASFEYRMPNSVPMLPLEIEPDSEVERIYCRMKHTLNVERQIIIIDDLSNYQAENEVIADYCRLQTRLGYIKSCVYVPLTVSGKFFGTFSLQHTDRVRHWTADDIELINAVATQLSIGLSQAELFESVKSTKLEWEATFSSMTDGVYIFNRTGKLTRVNQAGADLEQCGAAELLGKKCCEILPSKTSAATCMIDSVLATGEPLTIEFIPAKLKRPILVTAEPINDANNELLGVVCTVRDLFELRQAESIARERQSLLTYILEGVREPIFAADLEGKILWCNSALTEVTGYSKEEIISNYIFDLIPPDAISGTRHTMHEAAEGKSKTGESRYYNRHGEMRYAIFDSIPLVVDGKSTGIIMFARDITEQKLERRRIAEADKLRALGQLASGVAHDFNNSLATILGRTQILRRVITDQNWQKNLEIIQKAAEDGANVVKRIQTFARKTVAGEFEKLDLTGLLQDSIEFTRTRWEAEAKMRGVTYSVVLEEHKPLFIRGIAFELREVFVNLIFNALDAMPQGGNVRIQCHAKNNKSVLNFIDNGSGMTEKVREKIFEPFFSTKGVNGTGLGLSITYSIIREHQGEITVFSTPNQGTKFEIVLPLAQESPALLPEPAVTSENSVYEILVVDDDNLVRETLVEILKVLNHRVTDAPNGAEAVKLLETKSFDLVLTDFSMRGMSGKDLAQIIRERWEKTKIILVSGYGDSIATGEVPEVDCIVTKPVDLQHLSKTIQQIVGAAEI